MRYFIDKAQPSAMDKIKHLAFICEIDEPIDEKCDFLCAFDKELGLVGVAGVNLKRDLYPQFEHIIIHPKRQRTRVSVMLMNKMEEYLKNKEYKEYVAFIKNDKKMMQEYAMHWGMKEYSKTPRGVWYFKSLTDKEATRWLRHY